MMVSFQTHSLKHAIEIRPLCKILLDYFLKEHGGVGAKANSHSANNI